MNNEFKAIIGIMRASNLLVEDLKKTLKNYPINVTEFSVMELEIKKQYDCFEPLPTLPLN